MSGWDRVHLSDVCAIVMGQAPSGDAYNDRGKGFPLIAGASDFGEHYPAPKKFTAEAAKLSAKGDIVLGIRATIGEKVWSDGTYALGRGVAALRPGTRLDRGYLWHWLTSISPELSRRSKGATFKQVTRQDIGTLLLDLPPLSEQHRIAAILDKTDELRTKRRAGLESLELLPEAFLHDLRRAHPDGWRVMNLSDAYWFQEGPGVRNWQFRDSGVKLLNVANIEKDGTLNLCKTSRYLSHEEIDTKYRHFLVDAGDLVIASSGISFEEDGLLRTRGAFVESHHLPLCMNTSTIRFKAAPGVSSLDFLWVWLNGTEFRTQITKLVTGSAQQNFGPSHLRALRISLPLPEVQGRLSRLIAAFQRTKRQMSESEDGLQRLFVSLQHRAFVWEL